MNEANDVTGAYRSGLFVLERVSLNVIKGGTGWPSWEHNEELAGGGADHEGRRD